MEKIKKFFIKIKNWVIKAGKKIWGWVKCFFKFATSKPNFKENIFQYLFRQILLTDSDGNPSWTITILFLVAIMVGWVVAIESKVALSTVTVATKKGVVTTQLKGFSSEFLYLVITLAGVITFFFRSREKQRYADKMGNEDTTTTPLRVSDPNSAVSDTPQNNDSSPEQLVQSAINAINQIKSKIK